MKLVTLEKYGVKVWANEYTESLRRTECLCFNCELLDRCIIAAQGLALCKTYNIAFMVTRCPVFIPKATS